MYSTLASIIKFVQPCMAKYRKSHFWLAHPEDVIFKKKVLLQNTQGTIPVPLHYVEIGSKMQNFKPIYPNNKAGKLLTNQSSINTLQAFHENHCKKEYEEVGFLPTC